MNKMDTSKKYRDSDVLVAIWEYRHGVWGFRVIDAEGHPGLWWASLFMFTQPDKCLESWGPFVEVSE